MSSLAEGQAETPPSKQSEQARPPISTLSAALQLGTLAVGGAIAILLAGDSPTQLTITLTLIYATYAAAWNIVAGFAGQFTFGHAAFFGFGAYAAAVMSGWTSLAPLYGLWFGVAVAGIVAAAIGIITLKLRGLYFALVTAVFPIVFSVFATYLGFQEVSLPFNPQGGIGYFSPSDPRVLSVAALCATIGVSIVAAIMVRSHLGLALRAVRADQDAAEASGVQTTRVKIYALVLSAALSAVAGGLYACAALVVTPGDVFGVQMSVKPVLFTVFGGIGTLAGPIVGTIILVPLSEHLTAAFGSSLPGLSGLVYGGALLLVITIFPAGLVPVITSAFAALRGKRSSRDVTAQATAGSPPTIMTADAREQIVPPSSPDRAIPKGGPILEIIGISKAFGGTKVLQNVTIRVPRGEILGVIGPNGAGKTTLFNIINGFLRPDNGAIVLGSRTMTNARPSSFAKAGLGRTFQTVRLFAGMSALENVLVAALTHHSAHREALRAAWQAIGEVRLSDRGTTLVTELTTGELRRLELARAIATVGQDGVLLLDEFLGGLTRADSIILLAALQRWRARGGTIVAIEHTMRAMAGFVDRFVVLNFGEVIAEGSPDEIWRNREVVRAYLGEKWVA